LDIVIPLRSINQRSVRGENDGNFATQRDVLVGRIIDQAGNEGSNRDKEAEPVAMAATFFGGNA
jgi:hypothetical protein